MTRAKGPHGGSLSQFPSHEACLRVLLLPPVWDASPSQGYRQTVYRQYTFIHLGKEKQSGIKFLV